MERPFTWRAKSGKWLRKCTFSIDFINLEQKKYIHSWQCRTTNWMHFSNAALLNALQYMPNISTKPRYERMWSDLQSETSHFGFFPFVRALRAGVQWKLWRMRFTQHSLGRYFKWNMWSKTRAFKSQITFKCTATFSLNLSFNQGNGCFLVRNWVEKSCNRILKGSSVSMI